MADSPHADEHPAIMAEESERGDSGTTNVGNTDPETINTENDPASTNVGPAGDIKSEAPAEKEEIEKEEEAGMGMGTEDNHDTGNEATTEGASAHVEAGHGFEDCPTNVEDTSREDYKDIEGGNIEGGHKDTEDSAANIEDDPIDIEGASTNVEDDPGNVEDAHHDASAGEADPINEVNIDETPNEANTQDTPQDPSNNTTTPSDDAQDAVPPVSPPSPTPDSAKTHSRPDSFARTVSEGINWNDDDEGSDFALSRTNTDDPFKFMAPSDRSNSFPDVPPPKAEVLGEHPLRQSEDFFKSEQPVESTPDLFGDEETADDGPSFFKSEQPAEETPDFFGAEQSEDDAPGFSKSDQPTYDGPDFFGSEQPADDADFFTSTPQPKPSGGDDFFGLQPSDGGDFFGAQPSGGDGFFNSQDTEAAPISIGRSPLARGDSEARFEEGMPLIRHNEGPSNTQDPGATISSPDDDFFSRVQDTPQSDESGFVPSFGRKSTMQVTGLVDGESSDEDNNEDDVDNENDLDGEGNEDGDVEGGNNYEEGNDDDNDYNDDDNDDNNNDDDNDWITESSSAVPGATPDPKWDSVFSEGESFLPENNTTQSKVLDPAALFGSDDEGFLELDDDFLPSDDDAPTQTATPLQTPAQPAVSQVTSRYVPQAAPPQPTPSPYMPNILGGAPAVGAPFAGAQAPPIYATPQTFSQYAPQPPPPQLAQPRAESFVDKSRGGYASPYDLPSDLMSRKPQKAVRSRPAQDHAGSGPPSRAVSMQVHPTPGHGPHDSLPPPGPHVSLPPSGPPRASPAAPSLGPPAGGSGFFEELPMTAPRSRPVSRGRASPPKQDMAPQFEQPSMLPPNLTSPTEVMPMMGPMTASMTGHPAMMPPTAAPPPMTPQAQINRYVPSPVPNLVAPAKVNPYGSSPQLPPQQSATAPPAVPSSSASRYSPAPAKAPTTTTTTTTTAVPPPPSRYSPASTRAASYTSSHPHMPRTSSPLAHFEITHEKVGLLPSSLEHPDRNRSVSAYEPRDKLPPTREEDDEGGRGVTTLSPEQVPYGMPARHTPPLPASYDAAMLSPPKRHRANYAPYSQQHPQRESNLAPPVRSQTMSPGGSFQRSASREPPPRPSSVQSAHVQPADVQPQMIRRTNTSFAPSSRPRGLSASFDLIPPSDGRQQDPLQRWKGAPLITWGVGGSVFTTFPKDVPRYLPNQPNPLVMRTPGEVTARSIKDVNPLDDLLAKFPGPLKGKGKKKETIAWLASGIEMLERALPDYELDPNLSHLNKRDREKILLWKVVKLLVEHDGVLEGTRAVETAVREVLAPGLSKDGTQEPPMDHGLGIMPSQVQADAVDATALDNIRRLLMLGDREKAVWVAADKRLWGHAMLMANTVSSELYGKVTQEFVRKEVNYPGHNNESIAALYNVLSGNFDECVDELVPAHARAGFQMMQATTAAAPTTKDAMDGLDKWQETLCLVLSNRRPDDGQAIAALGRLLGGYGRAEAAHVCFIFARTVAVFSGLDDNNADFVLVGSDHVNHPDQVAKDTTAVLLSEVYEFALSLAVGAGATPAATTGCPHLTVYKLQHALTLAEYGYSDGALAYCDAIARSMTAQTRRSPYHNAVLEAAVTDLTGRLRHAHKEDTGSGWMSKPNMNKVSDSVWNKFTKFVAGDEHDEGGSANGGDDGDVQGPFARVAGTPSISRTPSMDGGAVFGGGYSVGTPQHGGGMGMGMGMGTPMSGLGVPGQSLGHGLQGLGQGQGMGQGVVHSPAPPVASRAGSRYAPQPYANNNNTYSPQTRPSTGRSSGEYMRPNTYEPRGGESRPTSSYAGANYTPSNTNQAPSNNYTPSSSNYTPSSNNYTPSGNNYAPSNNYAPPNNYTPSVPSSLNQSPYMPQGSMSAGGSPYLQAQMSAPVSAAASAVDGPSAPASTVDGLSQGVSATSLAPNSANQGYEPPPYGYEPPSYEPPSYDADADEDLPKKKSFMDDDDKDGPPAQKVEKSREEKEREAQEAFRKVAEEDAKRHEEEKVKAPKRGWGFGWFGGKSDPKPDTKSTPELSNKPIKAKLGESNSFVYDSDLKRWVNKAPGAETPEAPKVPPPPPKAPTSRSVSGPLPPPSSSAPPVPPLPRSSTPMDALAPPPPLSRSASSLSLSAAATIAAAGGPPVGAGSRPGTSMSDASSIDDLLATGPRRGAGKKKKGARYVDVMQS